MKRKLKGLKSKDVYRVTLDFNPNLKPLIEALMEQSGCQTKAELFKQALSIFSFIIDELGQGNKIIKVTPKGKQIEVDFVLFLTSKTKS